MIPANSGLLSQNFTVAEQPSLTYRLDYENKTIQGMADGLDAVKQAVYKILNTERYRYLIYSRNYGIELAGLIGKPVSFVVPEIERRITEALLQDTRITSVDNFVFTTKKDSVLAEFTVHTIYGEAQTEKAVSV